MLALPSIVLGGTMLALAGMVLLVGKEQAVGRRIVLVSVRNYVDRLFAGLARAVRAIGHTISITCAYLVHQLRAALASAIAPRPRRRKQRDKVAYTRTDSHLSHMHDHKSDTALTEAQKKKLRNKKLEERF